MIDRGDLRSRCARFYIAVAVPTEGATDATAQTNAGGAIIRFVFDNALEQRDKAARSVGEDARA
jgi:hypothetical protein